MIYDRIENYRQYMGLSKSLDAVLEVMRKTEHDNMLRREIEDIAVKTGLNVTVKAVGTSRDSTQVCSLAM